MDVHSTVHNLGESTVTWDNSTFAGFYYDIDKNVGTETLTFTLTGTDPASKTLSDTQPRGVIYLSTAQPKNFKFKQWGEYKVIGFLAERYFAAYDDVVTSTMLANNLTVPYLYDASKNRNLMTNEQISKVLVDDNTEMTITSANPLKLQDGYELAVKSIDTDGNKVYVELSKNGQVVDSKVVQPSVANAKIGDKTYYFKTKIGDTTDIAQIAVHFKNAFRGADTNIATIDGVFQVSDTPIPLKVDQQYDKMSIRQVDSTAMTIKMDNKDNQITLSKNKDTLLMQSICIKTADQDDISDASPLRFYVYKEYTEPGTYEVRGAVHNLGEASATWDNSTFAGFYYDIDKNLGTETLTFTPTGTDPASKSLSDTEPRGAVYLTSAQAKNFKFKAWGQYDVIGFLAERYFAAYENTVTANMQNAGESVAFIADKSKNDNPMTNEQISKVLVDDDTERTITSANPLKMGEGYELAVKSIDTKSNKVYVELSKNGQVVDSAVVQPSIDNAKMSDKTYYFKTKIGDTADIVQIAVHFKNAFLGADTNIATIDGVFQVSDTATPLKVDQQYDKMSIRQVDSTTKTIMMDNKDNQITLSKNKDILLMTNIHIKTADQDDINDASPLRYYIYKAATVEGAAPAAAPAENVTAPAPAENVTPVKENVTPASVERPAERHATGHLVYTNTTEMILGNSYEYEARIAINKSISIPTVGMAGGSKIGIKEIPVLTKMEVMLTGDDFVIEPRSEKIQQIEDELLEGSIYGQWLWNVRPRSNGSHSLTFTAYMIRPDNTPIPIPAVRVPINVTVIELTLIDRIKTSTVNFVSNEENWKWIATVIIIPIGGLLYRRIKKGKDDAPKA